MPRAPVGRGQMAGCFAGRAARLLSPRVAGRLAGGRPWQRDLAAGAVGPGWGGSAPEGPTGGGDGVPEPGGGVRAFVGYNIYKGKAAVQFSPIKARFSPFTDRQGQAALRLDRQGTLLCEFAPAAGERKYDWESKQTFALSADELGDLLAMDAFKDDGVSFFHDPNMGGQDQGLVQKSLKVNPSPDGKALFFTLDVKSGGAPGARISVPVSKGEFAVLSSLVHSVLPSLLGWDLWRDFVHLGTDAEKRRAEQGGFDQGGIPPPPAWGNNDETPPF